MNREEVSQWEKVETHQQTSFVVQKTSELKTDPISIQPLGCTAG